jgi:hypothetical protein
MQLNIRQCDGFRCLLLEYMRTENKNVNIQDHNFVCGSVCL